jgi:hypothetical protein
LCTILTCVGVLGDQVRVVADPGVTIGDRAGVGLFQQLSQEFQRRLPESAVRAVEGTGDELVVVDQLQLDHSRSPEHGRAVLDTRVQDAGDELCVDKWPDAVMHHDHRAGRRLQPEHRRDEPFVATVDQRHRQPCLLDQDLLVGLPVLRRDSDDDLVDGRMDELPDGLLQHRHPPILTSSLLLPNRTPRPAQVMMAETVCDLYISSSSSGIGIRARQTREPEGVRAASSLLDEATRARSSAASSSR